MNKNAGPDQKTKPKQKDGNDTTVRAQGGLPARGRSGPADYPVWTSPCGMMQLRCGRWQDVLSDITECDAVITDPPYSERTHKGQRHGRRKSGSGNWCSTVALGYHAIGSGDAEEFSAYWAPRVCNWLCVFTSHDLILHWQDFNQANGLYSFAPLACVQRGMNVRLAGDGPSNWAVYLVASRTKQAHKWGTLPGAYTGNHDQRDAVVAGGKPLWLMREIVSDYSRLGDLIVDPCAGGGTTLLAAAIEGRRCIGAEMDPKTFELAVKRLSNGYTPRMQLPPMAKPKQGDLL